MISAGACDGGTSVIPAPAPYIRCPAIAPLIVPAARTTSIHMAAAQEPHRHHHVNPVAIVKAEPPSEAKPDMPPSLVPPWAVQVVRRRNQGRAPRRSGKQQHQGGGGEAGGGEARVIPGIPKGEAPWQRDSGGRPRWYDGAEQDTQDAAPPEHDRGSRPGKRARGGRISTWKSPETTGRGTKANQALASSVQLCARNYAAVDAKRERYGLIDQGLVDAGTRTMVIHVKRKQIAWDVLNIVKPGSILAAKSRSGRGSPTPLRVRFTTPNKYYSPGCKVTSMTIGIDETDWQSLMAKARRI